MSDLVIETKNLTRCYGEFVAVQSMNMQVLRGSIYGFLGENGAGKTTAIRMILGLIHATNGEVYLFGQSLKKNRHALLRHVGALVETPSAFGHLSGKDNLKYICKLRNIPYNQIDEVLDIVDLAYAKDKLVRKYSLGMRQRLSIAMALLGQPQLLILDEPTNGLDPSGIREIRDLIKSLPAKGYTILVSSHLLSEVEQIASHVGIIHAGQLLYQGEIENFTKRGQTMIHIKCSPITKAMQLLEENYPQVYLENGLFQMPGSEEQIDEIARLLVYNQISIHGIYLQQSNLESLFLDVIPKKQ
ncbi:ABC transporter ATP-binding protein [Thermoflavimicrobium dichotomicum]|uniref:ABC-2 type transport system ATP-binding protein n=1 Tax=Thermoflavimicrobium dichotomicum TaxID=46223 RepID=A0A1I3JKQ2_9BACL|nr:ABC transporter ATP-binding protein [Thermoflavimicrobium dichotomicum]SFI60859.1 ABC-2 type transport system ATP-binding protein [Thermoflavimicrobium dichotomicum]